MIAVTCYTDSDLVHSAYAVAGLIELAAQHTIKLRFRTIKAIQPAIRHPFAMLVDIERPGCPARTFALDFHDGAEFYCPRSLAVAEGYFKANFSREKTLRTVPAPLANRVRPFGPYFPCRAESDRGLLARAWGSFFAHSRWLLVGSKIERKPADIAYRLAHAALRVNRYRSRKSFGRYESRPNQSVPGSSLSAEIPLAFFNPTFWPVTSDAIFEVNRYRATVITGLRKALGKKFAGGFRRGNRVEEFFPEAVEDRHYSHDDYVQFVKLCPVSIYTNGLSECFSWRLIEIMAAGKAILSERIANELTFQTAGIEQFDSAHELVDAMSELAKNPAQIAAMSEATWKTYSEQLSPQIRMKWWIEEALQL